MTTLAVTGCSGYVGRRLCELLEEDESVGRVVGIDVREPSFSTRNLEFYATDVRSPDLTEVITGCDAVVHLAVCYDGEDAEITDVIVRGTRNVLDVVASSGAGKLIFVSSAAVYGDHADNDRPLTESSPVRPSPGRAYGRAKARAEEEVEAFAAAHPEVVVTILRPTWILGPSLPPPLVDAAARHVARAAAGAASEWDAVHEDDAAAAIVHVLGHDLPGTFNVAAREVDGSSPEVSGIRLHETGFAPVHSSRDALRAAEPVLHGWVRVGGLRFRLRWIGIAAASIAAVIAGSAARAARVRRTSG